MQDAILRLQGYWAGQGALIWQPYHTDVGAGTANPATFLRVLGPEPWDVAYVEPSIRPDDSRYGENPNRLQMHTQFQVILKPDPGNPQELYLDSLAALGIDRTAHDIRFVEDNWESPALGAWGLGWEVWLDGMEITQFTYFQQSGGLALDPVSVEITYGLERILMALQRVDHVMDLEYAPGITYGEIFLQNEFEQSTYNLDEANPERVRALYDLYEAEARHLLDQGLTLPAYDYILKTSHTFNLLDARGAIGVTERAAFFNRMRNLSRLAAQSWVESREKRGFPLSKGEGRRTKNEQTVSYAAVIHPYQPEEEGPGVKGETTDFVLEIGTEELPAQYVDIGVEALKESAPKLFSDLRLSYTDLRVEGTPRRLIVRVDGMETRQSDREELVRGPAAKIAFDADGNPTKAAQGFARGKGLDVPQLERREEGGVEYVFGVVREEGRPASEVLAEALPGLIGGIAWPKSMRWNASNVAFGRPVRWIVALLGEEVVPFTFAGMPSGRISRGLRPAGSPEFNISGASQYLSSLESQKIVPDLSNRKRHILDVAQMLAGEPGGKIPESAQGDLLDEVANLVENPVPIRGSFEEKYLELPREVLVTVMRKHQRYFPVEDEKGNLLPHFVTVANGQLDEETVRHGNEEVLRARYSDARFFWERDTKRKLEEFRPKLSGLIFQERLGSMLDKSDRMEKIVAALADELGLAGQEKEAATRAAHLAKADLVTEMVMDFTSLQGIMGRHYARLSGESDAVAEAIGEQYSNAPSTLPGVAVGLADRLDSLVGLFAVGKAPKSNADPFAQRRAAIGVIETLAHRQLPFDLRNAIESVVGVQPVPVDEAVKADVLEFIARRLEQWLLDRGLRPDVVQAAVAPAAQGHDPSRALKTAEQLAAVVETEEFEKVLTAYARTARITRGQEIAGEVDPTLFVEEEERNLWQAYGEARSALDAVDPQNLNALYGQLRTLHPAIDTFFDKVLVMAEDEAVRLNRLRLLKQVADLTQGIVDLSQLQGF